MLSMETFFDITDLVAYLVAHGNVTGIQRVIARVLAELADSPQAASTWCVALEPGETSFRGWRLDDVFAGAHGDEIQAFVRLVEDPACRRWPTRPAVRRHLNRRGATGWRRAAGKAAIYSLAVCAPKSLERAGLISRTDLPPTVPPHRFSSLPPTATLVLPGAGWNDPRIVEAAARHAHAGGRVIHFVHDLIPIIRPEYFKDDLVRAFGRHFTAMSRIAAEFICISKHTQADLDDYLEKRGRSVPSTVVPLAHEFHGYPRNARGCHPANQRLLEFGRPDRNYFLCVGTLEVRKNGLALLEAWLHLQAELDAAAPHLVFCGRRGWKSEPFFDFLARHSQLHDRVHVIPSAADADLAYLHEQSLGSIYPSLYEGWGLPIGEAAWFGRSCIASRESSLPEVCGNRADYVDPQNPPEIAAAVRRAAFDPAWRAWRERLIQAMPLRTWRDVADSCAAAIAASRSRNLQSRRVA
jgi:glycosyltransferase involved in cell wall biosynthesis